MKNALTTIGISSLILISGCGSGFVRSSANGFGSGAATFEAVGLQKSERLNVGEDKAIEIAHERLRTSTGLDPNRHAVAACELSSMWLVIYDQGTEIVISKNTGRALAQRNLTLNAGPTIHTRITKGNELASNPITPMRADVSTRAGMYAKKEVVLTEKMVADLTRPAGPGTLRPLTESEAIAMAKEDAEELYGSLDEFKQTACQLFGRSWRVVFEVEGDVSGGGPDYVIDKFARRIVHKRYNQ